MLKYTLISLLCAGAIAVVRFTMPSAATNSVDYRTEQVKRHTISSTISATGTLEPSDIIDVGAQVAGRIIEFGTDPDTYKQLDYGSRVTKGMILARIDPSVYEIEVDIAAAQTKRSEAQLLQANSQLKEAEAALLRSEAELLQQQSNLDRSQRDWQRTQGLAKSNTMSQAEVDSARAEFEALKGAVAVGKASIEQSRARIETQRAAIEAAKADSENAKANFKRANRSLDYCSIVCPIDGTIIDRRVNLGQTVVASLSTPSLFLLATDLRKLEIWVSVNEADIGQVRAEMPVRFVVDSLPEKTFSGLVKQVRLNASMSQNVVTYTVVVSVDNESDLLLPYLTANIEFIVNERPNVVCVPAAALRYSPNSHSSNSPSPNSSDGNSADGDQPRVWIIESGKLKSVPVETGLSDGVLIEIVAGEIHEGDTVVVGQAENDAKGEASNPFVPRMRGTTKESR